MIIRQMSRTSVQVTLLSSFLEKHSFEQNHTIGKHVNTIQINLEILILFLKVAWDNTPYDSS